MQSVSAIAQNNLDSTITSADLEEKTMESCNINCILTWDRW